MPGSYSKSWLSCPKCGNGNDYDAQVCSHCGYRFSEKEISNNRAIVRRSTLRMSMIALPFFLIIFGGLFWLFS